MEDQMVTLRAGVLCALFWSLGFCASPLEAQNRERERLPLEPVPARGLSVSPFMEGWYDNGDGTYTISFGYFNRNESDTIRLPEGELNSLSPSEFNGMQPTTFLPGRHHGVFTVTIEGNEEDVWWRLRNPNGQLHENPGRARSEFYQLDYLPRPLGTVHPLVWFTSEERAARGPTGAIDSVVHSISVGEPLTLTINVRDPSVRDPDDPQNRGGVPLSIQWFEHRSPAPVEWQLHPSTQMDVQENEENDPDPSQIVLPAGEEGAVRVIATFSRPGEYVLRARVDNFSARDSSTGNQCCWTNAYVRVSVLP